MSYDCFCDYDPPTFYRKTIVKARNPDKCEECSRPINAGDKYEYVVGKWDGYVSDFKTCLMCVEMRQWAKISVPCFCWAHGSLHDDILEMVSEVRRDVPGFFFEYGRRAIALRMAGGSI